MTCFSMLAVCPTQAEIFFEWLNEDKGKKNKQKTSLQPEPFYYFIHQYSHDYD